MQKWEGRPRFEESEKGWALNTPGSDTSGPIAINNILLK